MFALQIALQARLRRDVDDLAASLRLHWHGGGLTAEDGLRQVHVQDKAPVVFGNRRRVALLTRAQDAARIVYQHIQASEGVESLREHLIYLLALRDIGGDAQGANAQCFAFGHHALRRQLLVELLRRFQIEGR